MTHHRRRVERGRGQERLHHHQAGARQSAVDQVGLTDPFLLGRRVGGGAFEFLPDAFAFGFREMRLLSQEVLVLVHVPILPKRRRSLGSGLQ